MMEFSAKRTKTIDAAKRTGLVYTMEGKSGMIAMSLRFCYSCPMHVRVSPTCTSLSGPNERDGPSASPAALHAGFQRVFALRAVCRTVSWGLLAAVLPLLVLRLFAPGLPRAVLAVAALAIVTGVAFAAVRRALRRAPTREQCRARLDAASRAGGLVLCAGLPGADAWPTPSTESVPVPVFAPGPHRLLLPLGVVLVAVVLLLPDSILRRMRPAPPPPGLTPVVASLEEKIEDLLARDLLTPEDAEPLREWLEQLSADPESLGSPATLEALDHLSADLDRKALAETAAAAAGTAPPAAATPSITPQVDSLDADARKLLESLAALDPMDPRCSTGTAADAKEALEQLLQENADRLAQERAACQKCGQPGCDGDCQGEGAGEGDGEGKDDGEGVGSGAPTRGPGSAELVYGLPVDSEGLSLQDQSLRSSAPAADPNDTSLVGLSASAPDVPATPAATASGALSTGGTPSGTSRAAPTLPRHQSAIREYFEP